MQDLADKAKSAANDAKGAVKDAAGSAKGAAKDAADSVKDVANSGCVLCMFSCVSFSLGTWRLRIFTSSFSLSADRLSNLVKASKRCNGEVLADLRVLGGAAVTRLRTLLTRPRARARTQLARLREQPRMSRAVPRAPPTEYI